MKRTSRRPRRNPGPLDNSAFRRWFGASKVVDERGEPDVLYHATFSDFDTFRVNAGSDEYRRFGFHVGPMEAASSRIDIKLAEDARDGVKTDPSDAKLLPLYVRSESPLRLDENRTGRWGVDDVMQALMQEAEDRGVDGVSDEMLDDYASDQLVLPGAGGRAWSDAYEFEPGERSGVLVGFLRQIGYDSIVYENKFEGGGDSYLLFDPRQAKSATDNVGTYDPADPSILRNPAPDGRWSSSFGSLIFERAIDGKPVTFGEVVRNEDPETDARWYAYVFPEGYRDDSPEPDWSGYFHGLDEAKRAVEEQLEKRTIRRVQIAYHCGSKPPSESFDDFRKHLRSGEGMGYLGPGIYFATSYDAARSYCKYAKEPTFYKVKVDVSDFYDPIRATTPHVQARLRAAVEEAGFKYSDYRESYDAFTYGRGWIGYLNDKLGTRSTLELLLKHGVRGQLDWVHTFWELAVYDPSTITVVDWEEPPRSPAQNPRRTSKRTSRRRR
jgi:hypothetical protein